MKPERYQEVKRLFAAVCELTPEERDKQLHRACAGDAQLRFEVESLLAHDGQPLPIEPGISAASALARLGDGMRGSSTGPCFRGRLETELPEWVGRYRILGLLGEGGMGTVYLAEQEQPKRQVALKVVRAGTSSRAMLRRFEHEATILGQLAHPGIAQIHEAGVADIRTAAGLLTRCPFFAMEYLPGKALGDYVECHHSGVAERLTLIASICDAVHHAHQKGVVHRDLKPSNILVDAQGQPKVLDFGIARVTDSDVKTVTTTTAAGQLVGTIPYMSPEQVTGVSAEVDTRSDVYALGVICYELLTGHLPYDVSDRSIPEAVRMIREDEPTRLSAVDTLFRGDLDTILGKALEKEKERRYQSSSEFAADIRNYLDNRPIVARSPTTFYQLRMFARRNRTLVGGVVATLLALVIGIVGIAIQADRVAQERDVARQAERLADNRAYAANIAAAQSALRANDVTIARQRLGAARPELRNWEWRFLANGLDTSQSRLALHKHHVWSVAYAPNGKWLVSGSADRTLTVWDTASGQVLRTLTGEGGKFRGADISSNGRRIVAAEESGLVHVWSYPDGDKVMTLSGHADTVVDAVFSPDGRLIASASYDRTARLWDAETGELLTLLEHPHWVHDLAFAPDATHLLTGCRDNVARLWNVTTGEAVIEIKVLPKIAHWDFIHCWAVAVGPDGERLATGAHDGMIKLWSAASGELLTILAGHTARVRSLDFSTDGTRLASASDDGTVRLWDLASGTEVNKLLGHGKGGVFAVGFSPDGAQLASAGADGIIRIWNAQQVSEHNRIHGHKNRGIPALAVSPNGTQLLSGGIDGVVRLWDMESRNAALTMRGHRDSVYTVAISPDGVHAASGSRDGEVRIWDAATGTALTTPLSHTSEVRTVVFNPKGAELASAAIDGTIVVWDVGSRSPIKKLTSQTNEFTALAWSPDGKQLASGSSSGAIEFWDAATWHVTNTIQGHEDRIWHVTFSPDGTRLVSSCNDMTAKLWCPRTGSFIAALRGHTHAVSAAAFTPDGTRVATVSFDRMVNLWDPVTGEPVLSFKAHMDWPWIVVFSPDGTKLVTGSISIRIWDAPHAAALVQ